MTGKPWKPDDPHRALYAALRRPAVAMLLADPSMSNRQISAELGGTPGQVTVWRIRQQLEAQHRVHVHGGHGCKPPMPHRDDCWCRAIEQAREWRRVQRTITMDRAWMADAGRQRIYGGRTRTTGGLSCGHKFTAEHGMLPRVGDVCWCVRCGDYAIAAETGRRPPAMPACPAWRPGCPPGCLPACRTGVGH